MFTDVGLSHELTDKFNAVRIFITNCYHKLMSSKLICIEVTSDVFCTRRPLEVKLNYLDKQYQVTMSVQQLAMLLCFESKNTLPLSYLATATGLTGELLVKNVRAIADSGILSVHDKVEKEAEHVNNTVQQDRKYYMECTIVRIMKTRKVLKHAALVNEYVPKFIVLDHYKNIGEKLRA
uniref:Cullin protein neddylation domain-containing protein n=1 Tax=Parascaris equorum TaxID=6256 RepID=A0A914RQK2_PAREQ